MDTFLQLPAARRHSAFQQVDDKIGLQAVSVEKDLWVCWTLRELFALPGVGEHLTFKGGTSLSKAWKLIQRFSEDIDIIVDKEVLGFGGDAAPDKAPSNKQRKARLENLMESCRLWVQGTLQPALAERLNAALGETGWTLEVDPDMPDGQCLLFHYPSVFPTGSAGYVRPVVKIELGARSDDWPHESKSIQPYVIELFPALDPDAAFSVRVLAAERTFFQLLTGLAIPLPPWNTQRSPSSAGSVPILGPPTPRNDLTDPEWLKEWLSLPRLPVLSDNLPRILDSHERELAALILQRIRSGRPIDFHYFGGSEPGKPRQVLPVMVFTTAADGMPSDAGDPNPLYLLSWCLVRNGPRTFRLDRMQVDLLKSNS